MTLLKCFKSLNKKIQTRLLIIGYGTNKSKIINFIKHNKLGKSVKVLDFNINPYPYIKKSDLFVLTSRYEGLPNVLLEAAVLKKFIISSNCPTGPKEILSNGKGGFLFEVGNYKDLSNQILKFAKRKKNLKSKINYTYKNLRNFDFYKNLNKYYVVIKKFL